MKEKGKKLLEQISCRCYCCRSCCYRTNNRAERKITFVDTAHFLLFPRLKLKGGICSSAFVIALVWRQQNQRGNFMWLSACKGSLKITRSCRLLRIECMNALQKFSTHSRIIVIFVLSLKSVFKTSTVDTLYVDTEGTVEKRRYQIIKRNDQMLEKSFDLFYKTNKRRRNC